MFEFDEPPEEDIGFSKTNSCVQVSDPKADYVSDCLYYTITDQDVLDCKTSSVTFSRLNNSDMAEYFQAISGNKCDGRVKRDYFLPHPTSSHQTERDLINDFRNGPVKYWPIGSLFQSSETEIPISILDEMGMSLPIQGDSEKIKGSCDLGETYEKYVEYASHMISEDTVTGNLGYLYEHSKPNSPLDESEHHCINCYKDVVDLISKTRIHSYAMYLRRLAENIMHSSRKVRRNRVSLRVLGDHRIISIQNHSNLATVESGPLCSFIIKMTQADLTLYSKFQKCKVLFANDRGEIYVYISWRSFDLTDCTIMLRAHYNLLVFPLLFTDSLDPEYKEKTFSCLKLLVGLIQCRNSEVFQILSCFRYIMPGVLNRYHNISKLILDKFPRQIRSPFTDYILMGLMDWLVLFGKTLKIKDRSKSTGNVSVLDEYDVEFKCLLPYLKFEAINFDQYLSCTYLISMTVGKTKQSRHVQLGLAQTLMEWQDKADSYLRNPEIGTFSYSRTFVEAACSSLLECVQTGDGGTDEVISKFLRTKGTMDDLNMNFKKLFDRTLYELDHPIHECTVKSLLLKYEPESKMRMAVRDDHAGEREIFVTSLPAVCALNVIENVAHTVNEQLPSEHITLGGDKKIMVMQNEAQASLDVEEKGWTNFLGSEDASKWSTGDNPEILELIWNNISNAVDPQIKPIITNYFSALRCRDVIFSDSTSEYIKKRTGKSSLSLTQGWPQGFFNKISSLKHFLCYCLGIAMFKKAYNGDNLVKLKFAVHSDDSRHRVSIEDIGKGMGRYYYEMFIKCLEWAKRKFLIRTNIKKSFYGGIVSEYLSNFQFHGSLFVPKSKFILNIFGDLTGSGYPCDIYAVMERIRTTLRMNVGISLGRFMMSYANHYVLRLYSMLPGMRNHDPRRNTSTNLIELGGIFSCHPIYLLFLGCKAHDILHYSLNKGNVYKMIEAFKDVEDLDENSASEIYNHFLPIPTAVIPEKGSIRHVRRRFLHYRLADDERWMPLFLTDLNVENSAKVARSLLYSSSMAKAYSTAPEGLMYARIQQSWDKPAYRCGDKFLTFWEFVRHIESGQEGESEILNDLVRASPTLLAMYNLETISDAYFGEVTRTHVISSVVNRINIVSPGGNEYRYLKYALANLAKLDINIPVRVDMRRLSTETDILEKDITMIPGIDMNNLRENMQKVYKYLNVRNAKPSYLHLSKSIYEPSRLDMYELVSTILKQYSSSIVGKVNLGKMSTVHVGERSFRPENISYRVNRDDEIHTAAKVVSLAKINLKEEEYLKFLSSLKIGGKSMPILLSLHPFRSINVSYYLDYVFLCKEYGVDIISDSSIIEQDYDDGCIIRSNNNCAFVSSSRIWIHNQINNDESFKTFVALCYLRYFQYNLLERDNWEDTSIPKELITVCPELYFVFERSNTSVPKLSYNNGKIVYKTGFSNHYFKIIEVRELDFDILRYDGEVFNLTKSFEPNLEFTEMFMDVPEEFGSGKKSLGIGIIWEDLHTYSVGELAKFNCAVDCNSFSLLGTQAKYLFDTRYFATDDCMLLKKGVAIPDVSRHKQYTPHVNISTLTKEDFDDFRFVCHLLIKEDTIKTDRVRLSLFYEENVEPERSVFSLFSRSRLYSSQFKNILSYNAYLVLCQNLQAIRCRIEHERTLSVLSGKIKNIFYPKMLKMKRSKFNMFDLIMHVSALIGIYQEVDSALDGDLSGTEMIEFVKYWSYSGCTANVWSKMFSLYMTEDEMNKEDWSD
jgi:hypothetical protein